MQTSATENGFRESVAILKGEPAPYDGVLVGEETFREYQSCWDTVQILEQGCLSENSLPEFEPPQPLIGPKEIASFSLGALFTTVVVILLKQ